MNDISNTSTNSNRLEPITVIVTCFNEERSVSSWCRSFMTMNILPQELIVSDSDSTDSTLSQLAEGLSHYPGQLIILKGKCNIAAGRNKAINAASHRKIAVTDFGVTFHPAWLTILSAALDQHDWVGGCYELVGQNPVGKSYCRLFNTPVALLDAETFLPSSRSFGLTREAVLKVGDYNDALYIGEDTELVLRLRRANLSYKLARDALVHWTPRSSLRSIYMQHFRYAYWDGVAAQNWGRWKHIAYLILLVGIPVIGVIIDNTGKGLFLGLLASVAFLFVKTIKNTRRSGAGFPRPLDLLVYASTLLASSLGYFFGLISAKVKSDA